LFEDGFDIARMALEAACHYSIYCKEPLDIIEVTDKNFSKNSQSGHKVKGKALTTLSKRKGVGDLVAIERSSVRSSWRKSGPSSARLQSSNTSLAKASRNGSPKSKKKKRQRKI
jgi:hypothetical protein